MFRESECLVLCISVRRYSVSLFFSGNIFIACHIGQTEASEMHFRFLNADVLWPNPFVGR